MMIKRLLVTFAMLGLLASAPVAAQLTGQIGYAHITDDFDLGAVVGSFGMEFDVTHNFALVPEFRAGLGVRDDTVGGVKMELDHLFGVSNRFQFNTTENFYLFGSLSYVRYKLTAKTAIVSASDSSWEWGYGGGLGFRLNPGNALDLSYERVDGVDVLTAGWRFRF
jgi:opacity protein-like surface antigen